MIFNLNWRLDFRNHVTSLASSTGLTCLAPSNSSIHFQLTQSVISIFWRLVPRILTLTTSLALLGRPAVAKLRPLHENCFGRETSGINNYSVASNGKYWIGIQSSACSSKGITDACQIPLSDMSKLNLNQSSQIGFWKLYNCFQVDKTLVIYSVIFKLHSNISTLIELKRSNNLIEFLLNKLDKLISYSHLHNFEF